MAKRIYTRDALTFDRYTIDSTGAFLVGELERLDPTMHEPLVAVTWGRDIDLREDVTIADEVSSFTNSSFAAPGALSAAGKSWIGKNSNAIVGVQLDLSKTAYPLTLWGKELEFTIPELESAMRLGRPIDAQKLDALRLSHQMDIDEMVYTGDTDLGYFGLANSPLVTTTNAAAVGTGSGTQWTTKTPQQILNDVNTLLTDVWTSSGWALMPSKLLLPPVNYSYLVSTIVSTAGNMSILRFLRENNLLTTSTGRQLDIQPVKWLTGAGVGGTNRMVAYTQDKDRVRYPMTPLQRTPIEFKSIYQITTYFCRLGVVEWVYPETGGYMDGI
ncbi:MAG: DUF2184 domain-containing protein [Gallionella sp.]|nr:DUF2184 domain-containing protein [Gallionella sp.]MDD4958394.1 DUF2184 domain-containing protein [Gallionella sp.]